MSALGKVVRSGVGRRRVQTVVIGLVVTLAVTSAVLGLSLMVASSAPFERAFGQQNGAHLTAQLDPEKVTEAQLSASTSANGVTAAAGPFRTAVITPSGNGRRSPEPITVVGRSRPDEPVDAVTLLSGRWPRAEGEITLQLDGRLPEIMQPKAGDQLTLDGLKSSVTLTVVGVARSVSETAGGWVTPGQVDRLTGLGAPAGYQMLYRFASASTTADIDGDRAAVAAVLPAGAVSGIRSWLTTRTNSAGNSVLYVPFLIAFGVLGVLMAVLIIGNVIAGAVSTGTRRIGILKALGFTPGQVVQAYTVQALLPALIGAGLGVVAGNLLVIPILAQTNMLYGTVDSGVTPWVDVVVAVGALAVVTLTAWAAASRAGRLRTVAVLAVGRTPGAGRGHWAARLTSLLPLPRPMTLGLAHPFARPLRSATIVFAIAFGAAAATFAMGLAVSLNQVQATDNHGDVFIGPGRPAPAAPGSEGPRTIMSEPTPPDAAKVLSAIAAQAGTSGYSGLVQTEVTAAGLTSSVEIVGLTGTSTSYGYRMVAGSWFTGPGQIVVATPFLTATHTKVGDTVVLTDHGTQIPVVIVGEAFNVENRGMQLLTDLATLTVAEPELKPLMFNVTLKPGTDVGSYVSAINNALGDTAFAEAADTDVAEFIVVIDTLATLLTLMLVTVAALGVLNLVVLETRERVHDLGVHKALGMTPRQTITMVISSVVVTGLIGGLIGTPIGVFLQRLIMGEMARVTGFRLPSSVTDIYQPGQLVLFGLGGLLIACVGALLPAGWAARTRTATALRTE